MLFKGISIKVYACQPSLPSAPTLPALDFIVFALESGSITFVPYEYIKPALPALPLLAPARCGEKCKKNIRKQAKSFALGRRK